MSSFKLPRPTPASTHTSEDLLASRAFKMAVLGAAVLEEMDGIWQQEVTSRYGFVTYDEMIATLEP